MATLTTLKNREGKRLIQLEHRHNAVHTFTCSRGTGNFRARYVFTGQTGWRDSFCLTHKRLQQNEGALIPYFNILCQYNFFLVGMLHDRSMILGDRDGAPGAIPTRDLPLRRRTLYATELREHNRWIVNRES